MQVVNKKLIIWLGICMATIVVAMTGFAFCAGALVTRLEDGGAAPTWTFSVQAASFVLLFAGIAGTLTVIVRSSPAALWGRVSDIPR